jgi:hypothetical protein
MYNDHDDNTFSKEDMKRQSNQYATATLDHYNSQENNMVYYYTFAFSRLNIVV